MAAPAPAPLEGTGGPPAAATSTKPTVDTVVVHPLVLLSVTDHYNRVAKDTRKRVVGVLLGETHNGRGERRRRGRRRLAREPSDGWTLCRAVMRQVQVAQALQPALVCTGSARPSTTPY
jgi:hypothetical protein